MVATLVFAAERPRVHEHTVQVRPQHQYLTGKSLGLRGSIAEMSHSKVRAAPGLFVMGS